MIELINVSKKYKDKYIFSKVNIKIEYNGVYLIKGENGMGKTTLLNIILKLTPYKGVVNNDHLNSVGCLWQNASLIEHLSVKEHLDLFEIDNSYLDIYGLLDKKDLLPCYLSSGEKQRLAFIIALYGDNELVILDEPFSNLNKDYAMLLSKEIYKYKNKKIIIIVSHNEKYLKNKIDGCIEIKNREVKFTSNCNKKKVNAKGNKRKLNKVYLKKYNKFYFKSDLKVLGVVFSMLLILIFIILGEYFCYKSIENDIAYNVEYNKFYLKECSEVINGDYNINQCYNPDDKILKNIDYKYNYDYLLAFLYSRNDLKVISNSNIELKKGRYPVNENEIIANDSYDLGEIIYISSDMVLTNTSVDFYKEEREVKVVGIYHDPVFKANDNLYFDYDALKGYFDNKKLVNNNISINEYYDSLEINHYKYLVFYKVYIDGVICDNNEEKFYSSLFEVMDKIVVLLDSLKVFLIVACIYFFIRNNKDLLDRKVKEYGYLLSNGFDKMYLIVKFSRVYMIAFVHLFILTILFYHFFFSYELILMIFILIVIYIGEVVLYLFKDYGEIMRNQYD